MYMEYIPIHPSNNTNTYRNTSTVSSFKLGVVFFGVFLLTARIAQRTDKESSKSQQTYYLLPNTTISTSINVDIIDAKRLGIIALPQGHASRNPAILVRSSWREWKSLINVYII